MILINIYGSKLEKQMIICGNEQYLTLENISKLKNKQ